MKAWSPEIRRRIAALADEMRAAPELFQVHPELMAVMDRLREARQRGHLTPDELLMIAERKSTRRAKLVTRNSADQIRFITGRALDLRSEDNDAFRVRLLTTLEGVRAPVASCILAWIWPDRWGVLDQRAWQELHQRGIVSGRASGQLLGVNHWSDYMDVVRELAGRLDRRPQEIDFWLYSRNGGALGRPVET